MKILVLLLAGVGDALLFTPALRVLRKNYPRAEITALVMYKATEELIRGNPSLDKLVRFDFLNEGHFRSLRFLMKLRREKFDVCILAFPANRWQYNLISFLTGAKMRIVHRYNIKKLSSLGFLQSKRVPIDFFRHQIDENVELVKALGATVGSYSKHVDFPLDKAPLDFAENFLKQHATGKRAICVHPGSSELSGMSNKRWSKDKFAELCDKMISQLGATVLLLGGKNEAELRKYICEKMQKRPVLVPELELKYIGAIIKKCAMYVGNDTLFMQLASIVGTPSVVIEGPTNPYKTAPLENTKILCVDIDCRPCYEVGEVLHCKYRNGRYDCLEEISVQRVFDAVKGLLL